MTRLEEARRRGAVKATKASCPAPGCDALCPGWDTEDCDRDGRCEAAPPPEEKRMKTKANRFVVVRTYSAGVHCGTLVSHKGKEVVLSAARRVWRWRGANTLNELSLRGATEEWTRISEPVELIHLTEAIEVISATAEAKTNLTRSRWDA